MAPLMNTSPRRSLISDNRTKRAKRWNVSPRNRWSSFSSLSKGRPGYGLKIMRSGSKVSALQLESGDAAIRINSERLSRRLVGDCLEVRSSTTRGRGHQTGLPTSVVGTFRTWRDVRLESAMRNKADIHKCY